MTDQPEALRVAERIDLRDYYEFDAELHCPTAARLLREQHAEIQELREFHQDVFDEKINILEDEIERLREQLRLANIDALNETAENEALRAAVLAEREACAQVCDLNAEVCNNNSMLRDVLMGNAAAIRARGFDVPDA